MSSLLLAHHDATLNFLRYAVLLEGGIVLGLSVFVFRLYRYARRLAALEATATGKPLTGASLYHVSVIASSHCLLVISAMAWITGHLGSGFVWYGTPLSGVAFTLSIYGLVDVLRYENSQISRYLKPYKERA